MTGADILKATPGAAIVQFFIALCCALAMYFLRKVPAKESPNKKTLMVFWTICYCYFTMIGISWLSILFNHPKIAEFFAMPSGIVIILELITAIYYIVSVSTKNKIIKRTILAVIFFIAAFFAILTLTKSSVEKRDDLPFLVLPTAIPEGTMIFIFIAFTLIFSIIIFRRDLSSGRFSFYRPESFYEFYAVMIYGSLIGIRILYFLPRISFVDIFFVFIPILMYLRAKPYLNKKNDNNV